MQEMWVWSLGQEDSMDEGLWQPIPVFMDRGAWSATAHGVTKSQTWLSDWAQENIDAGCS